MKRNIPLIAILILFISSVNLLGEEKKDTKKKQKHLQRAITVLESLRRIKKAGK